ncbi:hypothetical protein AB0E63_31545 [Kribbella sp. NPDC026596]|uniref:hypothetical protein n=1 Tax=Kribbella sp. NPDC026596 TaxID=3155122 RepID=UPI0033CB853A
MQLSPATDDPDEAKEWPAAFKSSGVEGLVAKGASTAAPWAWSFMTRSGRPTPTTPIEPALSGSTTAAVVLVTTAWTWAAFLQDNFVAW